MKDSGFGIEVERVESMQWNRTIAQRALDQGTQIEVSFPPDIDPEVIEKVKDQIKEQVLSDAAEVSDGASREVAEG